MPRCHAVEHDPTPPRIYDASLADYNDGRLLGQWMDAAREPEVADLARLLTARGAKIEGAGTETITIEGVKELKAAAHAVPIVQRPLNQRDQSPDREGVPSVLRELPVRIGKLPAAGRWLRGVHGRRGQNQQGTQGNRYG